MYYNKRFIQSALEQNNLSRYISNSKGNFYLFYTDVYSKENNNLL